MNATIIISLIVLAIGLYVGLRLKGWGKVSGVTKAIGDTAEAVKKVKEDLK